MIETADDGSHHHQLIDSSGLEPAGDAISGRIPLFHNSDVVMGVVLPADAMPDDTFYRNGEGDEMLFVHEGTGTLRTNFGDLAYQPGRLPRAADRHDLAARPRRGRRPADALPRVPVGARAAEALSQRLRPAPGALAVLPARHPHPGVPRAATDEPATSGSSSAHAAAHTAYQFATHPFDVVGWDGYLWPFAFDIADFQPITGRVHQPPPVHQTFQARNFVVCSFVPRKFDYHPLAIPAPYNHSNINSDEVIYYVAGNFMSRRGVGIASFTLHPAGIPHGPHPGTVEASIGKEATEELAVMVDTFRPLFLTRQAAELENPTYPYTWLETSRQRRGGAEPGRARPRGVPGLRPSTAIRRSAGLSSVGWNRLQVVDLSAQTNHSWGGVTQTLRADRHDLS